MKVLEWFVLIQCMRTSCKAVGGKRKVDSESEKLTLGTGKHNVGSGKQSAASGKRNGTDGIRYHEFIVTGEEWTGGTVSSMKGDLSSYRCSRENDSLPRCDVSPCGIGASSPQSRTSRRGPNPARSQAHIHWQRCRLGSGGGGEGWGRVPSVQGRTDRRFGRTEPRLGRSWFGRSRTLTDGASTWTDGAPLGRSVLGRWTDGARFLGAGKSFGRTEPWRPRTMDGRSLGMDGADLDGALPSVQVDAPSVLDDGRSVPSVRTDATSKPWT
eukprot:gene17513-biopygen2130